MSGTGIEFSVNVGRLRQIRDPKGGRPVMRRFSAAVVILVLLSWAAGQGNLTFCELVTNVGCSNGGTCYPNPSIGTLMSV